MNQTIARRVFAVLTALLLILTAYGCQSGGVADSIFSNYKVDKLTVGELFAFRDSCLSKYDMLSGALSEAYPDLVTAEMCAGGRKRIAAVLSGSDLDGLSADADSHADGSPLDGDLSALKSAYSAEVLTLVRPPLQSAVRGYAAIIRPLSADGAAFDEGVDTIIQESDGISDSDAAKAFCKGAKERVLDLCRVEVTAENADKFRVLAYVSSDAPDTLLLISNFDFPCLHDDRLGFALEFYSSVDGAVFSQPDTLYNCGAISYQDRNVVTIDMTKVLSGCEFAQLFKAYKRISFVLFAIDNSFSYETNLGSLRSDALMSVSGLSEIDRLNEILDRC